jgi:hypothetical protein
MAGSVQPTHHHTSPGDVPEATYRARIARFDQIRSRWAARSRRQANISTVLVVGALVAVGIGFWQQALPPFIVAGLLLLAFVASYAVHSAIDRREGRFARLVALNTEGLHRLDRNWATLPLRQPAGEITDPLALDLDLIGHASLTHLLNTAHTPIGQATLQRWLLIPATAQTATQRQRAVAELADLVDLRDELAVQGSTTGDLQRPYEGFLRWAEAEPSLSNRPALLWLSRLLPLLTIAAIVAQVAGWIAWPLWAIGVFLNGVLTFTVGRRVDELVDQVASRQRIFRAYADLFGLITRHEFSAPALQRLKRDLAAGTLRADEEMRRLSRIMVLADIRLWFFFLVIQLLTLWNFHVLWLFERWQRDAGRHARRWLDVLGEFEALAALATLRHDHPNWSFPTFVADRDPVLSAAQLGHPLLPPHRAVRNDVSVGPPGTFLLVTGSNMSGKSTLLRALGVNVVLAQAGGPVCAADLRLPPITLATSMRVQDSLEQGVSYFMAELQRLKLVVDAAQRTQTAGDRTLLFLLDEILHGTNTAERQIAARQIIRHLLSLNAIGAVSTHDLTLADSADIHHAAQMVHFTEAWTRGAHGPAMSFDYRLRPGLATSTNALKLMELVGLPLDVADQDALDRVDEVTHNAS